MDLEKFKNKLIKYKRTDIIITEHADLQAFSRNIDIEEIKDNLLNPVRLVYYKEQTSQNIDEEKYECFFEYQKNIYHKYAIILNRKIIIVTVIVINRNWQGAIK
jgi:hypothetical protein